MKSRNKPPKYVSPFEQQRLIERSLRLMKDGLAATLGADPDKLPNDQWRDERIASIRDGSVKVLALQDVLRELRKRNKVTWTTPLGEAEAVANSIVIEKILGRYGLTVTSFG